MIQGTSPSTLKFIGKKSLFMIPIVGWVFRWGFGNIPIDRSNRERAKQSLKHLSRAVIECHRSVAISPEGTRSKSGQLQDFKKGPFYLQADCKSSVTPAIIYGAYELWPPKRLFSLPGKSLVRYLPPCDLDRTKSRNANRLALRRVYLHALADDVPSDLSGSIDLPHAFLHVFVLMTIWRVIPSICYSLVCGIFAVGAFFGFSTYGTMAVMLACFVACEGYMFTSC
jgi:1-acyl-sn-glycerol-3-phosphate acyltransferase